MTTLHLRNSSGRSLLQRAFLLIPLAVALLALSPAPNAFGVIPAPDGGYPNFNTAEGTDALFSLTTGVNNTAVGFDALYHNTAGSHNTANGFASLFKNTTGAMNAADGLRALYSNTTGNNNTATGFEALFRNTAGGSNTALGYLAGLNVTGTNNTALGAGAGFNLTTGDNNIDVGNVGVASDANTIRIGTVGNQTKTFIAGINGVNEGGMVSVVTINSNGQLGTQPAVVSSRRFKKEIQPMNQTSEAILALKPVTFQYKSDNKGTPQFGLIAEEVAKVNPDLVVRDEKGEIYTVRYEAVNAMLLNEFLKQHRKVEQQDATIAKQQKQIEALATGLQKVSDQLELSKPAPRTVLNNQ